MPSVLRASLIASAAARRSLETSVTSLASIATSVPVPIAIAEIGLGERGSVVDPVADHRHDLARFLKPLDLVDLAAREDAGDDALDADLRLRLGAPSPRRRR